MLTIEPRMDSLVWARSPISFDHISLWCQLLDRHLTTYHSYKGDQIIVLFDLGMSTLLRKWKVS